MNFPAKLNILLQGAALAAAVLCMTACDPILDDDYGDCTVRHHVRFKYDYNMLGVDAFATQVEQVALYAFDADGVLRHQVNETADRIVAAGGRMEVPFNPETFRLIAWCHNTDCRTTELPPMECGTSTIGELTCRIGGRTAREERTELCEIGPIFHGEADCPKPENDDELNPLYTIPLVKNTNHIRIILQNLSSEPLPADRFDFTLVETNGLMNYDNSLLPDEQLTYVPFYTGGGTVEYRNRAADDNLNVAIAEFTFGRLMADRNPRLTVTNRETGDTVLSIPLTDYLKLARSEYLRSMGDQEYLDREDSYTLTFFLDEDESWHRAFILINSWRVVLMEVEI